MPALGLRKLAVAANNPTSFAHSVRTAVAAVVSLLAARLLRLPEDYWASITTIIVMQSTLGATLPVSAQRLVGTAVGASVGALAGTYFPGSIVLFGICVLAIGLCFAAVGIDRNAYRYAGITLAVVMLIPMQEKEWAVAMHRFLEVSMGIVVGLAITALWPEPKE
jgi:uncharacterized membrane protein YccC